MRSQHRRSLRLFLSLVTGTLVGVGVFTALPKLAAADLAPNPDQVPEPAPEPEKVFSEKDRAICNGKTLGDKCTAQGGGVGTCQSRACDKAIPRGDAGPIIIRGTCAVCADLTNDRAPIPGGDLSGGSCVVSHRSLAADAAGAIAFLGSISLALAIRRRRRANDDSAS